jgi:hypothetical protein
MPDFQRSPQFYARLGGVAYLVIIVLGLFGEAYVRGSLVVPDNGLATAARIAESPSLWRLGIAGDLLMHLLDVPLIVLFYLLLRPVSHPLALISSAFNLVQTSVLAVNKLTLIAPLLLASEPVLNAGLPSPVLGSLISLLASLHGYGFGIGLLFFGLTCIIRGHLLRRSGYFPPLLGTLLVVSGASYLVNSAALVTAPEVASALFPWVLLPAFVGELALALWLTVRGINLAAWQNQAQLKFPHANSAA